MAGQGTVSVNQSPQYGDKTALDSASKAVTETAMTGNAAPAPSAGRPATGTGHPQEAAATPAGVPLAHQEAAQDVARKAWAARKWAELANTPEAGPRVRMYAQAAQKSLEAAMAGARNQTPFFE